VYRIGGVWCTQMSVCGVPKSMFGVYRLEGWGIIVNAYIQRLVDLWGGLGYNCQHFFRVPFWVFVCVRGDMWDGGLGYNCQRSGEAALE